MPQGGGLVLHLWLTILFLLNTPAQFSGEIHKKLFVPGLCIYNNGLKLSIFPRSPMPWPSQVNCGVTVTVNTDQAWDKEM